jgi:quinoprotein glucose dehydrogenase
VGRILLIIGGVLLAGVAALFLTGSMVWWTFGFGERLVIDGRAEVVAAAANPAPQNDWPAYGGDPGGSRFSWASQVTPENVSQLQVAWQFDTGAFNGREDVEGRTAFENTPIIVDDKLVLCTPFNEVIAVDPGTGVEKWRFDPKLDKTQRPANQFVCRGVSQWRDPAPVPGGACVTRILMGTNDSRLIALDAANGQPCADFGVNGEVKIEPSMSLRWPGERQITSAPAIVGDTVVVGSAISDNLRVEAPRGTVHAFDIRTGAPRWTFDPVPRDAADPAYATWTKGTTPVEGHANVWTTISVDAKRGWVFLPTSSPSPDFFGGTRPGDNRYANSVVALEGATGRVIWHFQTVHHDIWDYDLPAQPGLYTITVDGKPRDVVAQAAKTGMIFVLDRDTGAPVLPVEERPTPQGAAPGEVLSPTQPFAVKPGLIVPDRVKPEDAFGVTGIDKAICADMIRKARVEGLFTPPSEQGTLMVPFTGGGANWGSTAFDATRNLLVVNMNNLGHLIRLVPNDKDEETMELSEDTEYAPMEGAPFGMTRELLVSPLGLPCTPPPWGIIAGVDIAKGEIVWRRVLGTTRDLAPGGIEIETGAPNLGGPAITAGGLIFITAAMDSYLRALDVETGKELWKTRLPATSAATPMTYMWQGRQYVVVAAGGYGNMPTRMGDHVVAFALPAAP